MSCELIQFPEELSEQELREALIALAAHLGLAFVRTPVEKSTNGATT